MLTFDLNSKNHIPLYEQLYKYIKNELETGKISAGEKLPSKRELASHLKISIGMLKKRAFISLKKSRKKPINTISGRIW